MMDEGAKARRFVGTGDSAWEILKIFLQHADSFADHDMDSLLIQQEVVDHRLRVPDTEAGKALLFALQESLNVHKNMQLEAAAGDPEAKAKLDETKRTLEEQIQTLRGSLPQRLLRWLGISVRAIQDLFPLSKNSH